MKKAKIIEHPMTRLQNVVEKQSKEIAALKIDVVVLKDLLARTVRILARYENRLPLKNK